ncbi:MAG: MmcQ/YjbR family DNA-binding protein [Oscillospiraceae bacterium]|nr:MmcQ/YjbR family DNA-binding protein [Oscillospiraceae bacterium]
MDLDSILSYCLSKPKSYEEQPFGPWPICCKVHGKIFAQLYPDKITLKCTAFQGQLFRDVWPDIVVRGYHCPPVQQPYWNTIDLSRFPAAELPHMIDLAYEAVLSGFSRKIQSMILE